MTGDEDYGYLAEDYRQRIERLEKTCDIHISIDDMEPITEWSMAKTDLRDALLEIYRHRWASYEGLRALAEQANETT